MGSNTAQTYGRATPLQFFIISSDPVVNGRFIDSRLFPKVGYIKGVPDMTTLNVKEVTAQERSASGPKGYDHLTWVLTVSLTEADAKQFETLTSNNVGRKLLVMIGEQPVYVGMIREPVEGGLFALTCDDASIMQQLKARLLDLQTQP